MIVATRKPLVDSGYRNILRKVGAGTVLYLPGLPEGMSQTVIPDYSGNGNNGTITGAVVRRLPSGLYYLDFDGTDDLVTVTHQANLNATTYTILAWVYLDDLTAGHMICSKHNAAATRMYQVDIVITTGAVTFRHANGTTTYVANGASNLSASTWYFLACTLTGVDGVMTVYINGVAGTPVNFVGTPSTTTANMQIGAISGVAGFTDAFLDGGIVLFRLIAGTALTATQVDQIYNQEEPLFS